MDMTKMKNRPQFALERFLGWLNWKDAPADDFRKLTDLIMKMSLEAQNGPLGYQATLRWDRKIDPLSRRIFQRFPTYSVPCLIPDARTKEDKPYIERRPFRKDLRESYDLAACHAIDHLFELFSAGILGKVRRCEWRGTRGTGKRGAPPCRRYFYGRDGKRFCSAACKRKNMRQRPTYREINALHQRVHYRAEKVKELRELAAVNSDYRAEYNAAKKTLEKVRKSVKRARKDHLKSK
jgi:hypothetical protein